MAARSKRPDNGKWLVIKRDNEMLAEYYAGVGVMPAEDVEKYLATMRTPLPTTFRVTPGTYLTAAIVARLESLAAKGPLTIAAAADGEAEETVQPPRPIEWYPHRHAWHFSAGRSQLRRCAELAEVHRFVVAQNCQGNITRQEEVSMIPPLLLDVRPHHRVLDMCAAPGSKTTELLELLHDDGTTTATPPTGFVVANEIDLDRSFMLAHQTKRMSSPCFLVTCNDAERYPETVRFDRVLCDVPCSGDGTLRKNPDLWARWHPRMAFRQHRFQVRIARRGAELLAVGGRLVYSTCSLNPVEDEAVVAELLRGARGALALVDVSRELPGLRRAAGVSAWRVYHDRGEWAATHDDVPAAKRRKIAPTVFPPTAAEAASFHLDRCLRILPHLQDTGGFFVAVFKKLAEMPSSPPPPAAEAEEEASEQQQQQQQQQQPNKKKDKPRRGRRVKDVEPFYIVADMPKAKEVLPSVRDYYGIGASFPFDTLVTRNKDMSKVLLVSRGVFDIISAYTSTATAASTTSTSSSSSAATATTPAVAAAQQQQQQQQQPQQQADALRIVHAGLKVLNAQTQRHIVKCGYRLSMESLRWVVPHMGPGRVVSITMEDFLVLLRADDPLFSELPTPATRESVERIDAGCFVVSVEGWPGMSLCAWRGTASCHMLIPKEEVASLRNLFLPGMVLPPPGNYRKKHTEQPRSATAPAAPPPPPAEAGNDGPTATAAPAPPSPPLAEPPAKKATKSSAAEHL